MKILLRVGMVLLAIWTGLVILGLMYFAVMIFGGFRPISLPGICLAEVTGRATNVSGFDFEFEEVDCDVIAKDSSMIVYVSRHGDRQRYALVKYAGNPPTVTSTGPTSVRITLGRIWGMHFRHDTWGDLHVDYDFERFMPPR